jgi:hypothetical protein
MTSAYALAMTRYEATARAASLNANASADEHWLVKETSPGAWEVVRLTGAGIASARPSGAHVESRPKPEEPADPRPAIFQNIPPFGPA